MISYAHPVLFVKSVLKMCACDAEIVSRHASPMDYSLHYMKADGMGY